MRIFLFYAMLFLGSSRCFGGDAWDLCIVGGGAAGLTAANTAAKLGKKILIFEKREKLGGGRFWSGDIPFKILFKNADIAYTANYFKTINMRSLLDTIPLEKDLIEKVCAIRDDVYKFIEEEMRGAGNISVIYGSPKFINDKEIECEGIIYQATHYIIATGASAYIPEIEGIETVSYIARDTFFNLKQLPKSMIVVGGGPLGVEMASGLSRLGVKITFVMKYGLPLPSYDFEMVQYLVKILEKSGVIIRCDMDSVRLEKVENGVRFYCQDRARKEHVYEAETIFFATGNIPNIYDLDLDKANVRYTSKGIVVDDTLKTTNKKIYAIGDVTGALTLSRVAFYHAKAAIQNLYHFGSEKFEKVNYLDVPRVIYTQPLFASVGLTEALAYRQFGPNIKVYRCPYKRLEKSYVDQNIEGLAKIICSPSGKLVGIHIIGAIAGDLIDSLKIGTGLGNTFLTELKKIRTIPTYFDLYLKIAALYEADFPQMDEEGFLGKFLGFIRNIVWSSGE